MNQDENSPWQYKPDGGEPASDNTQSNSASASNGRTSGPKSITWEAPEFIEHPHGAGWYASLVLITAVLAAVVYLTTKDYFAAATILTVGIIVGVFAGHKAQTAKYEASESGLSINGKVYPYSSFKSFGILREGELSSVNFFPLKRFMPPISAYLSPADENKVAGLIGDFLPYEEHSMDSIDRLSRRLRL